MHLLPLTIHPNKQITFTYNQQSFCINTKPKYSLLIGTMAVSKPLPILPPAQSQRFLEWFEKRKQAHQLELAKCQKLFEEVCSDNPLAFWDKEKYFISLPTLPGTNPTKASHVGMNIADTKLCRQEL